MDDRFFEAWITRSWSVCGQRLRPLCLGHIVTLAAVRSPAADFSTTERQPFSPGDLLIAARLCAEAWPHPGDLRPRLRDCLWRILLQRYPALFLREARKWDGYLSDHLSLPEFWQDEIGGRDLSAPAALSKAAYLLAETSLTEERVWSMPVARVDFLIGAIEDRRNGLRFLYDDELQDDTPDINHTLSEAEIRALAAEQLGPARFAEWLAARTAP